MKKPSPVLPEHRMINAGLILEGGGMRGVYTAGVLDCFLESGVWFQNIYAVSAGACHACSYLSGQLGRGMRTVIDYVGNWRYGSFRSLIVTGDYFGSKFVYDTVPHTLLPFDYEAYALNPVSMHIVLTNMVTGQAEYPEVCDLREDMDMIRASSSLPMMARPVMINNIPYLDGGVADPIPLARSIADGHDRNVVVMTRDGSYRKPPDRFQRVMRMKYRKYPKLVQCLRTRHELYNETLDLVYAQRDLGQALVIQPQRPVRIDRLEKDTSKLEALYREGYADARATLDDILQW